MEEFSVTYYVRNLLQNIMDEQSGLCGARVIEEPYTHNYIADDKLPSASYRIHFGNVILGVKLIGKPITYKTSALTYSEYKSEFLEIWKTYWDNYIDSHSDDIVKEQLIGFAMNTVNIKHLFLTINSFILPCFIH